MTNLQITQEEYNILKSYNEEEYKNFLLKKIDDYVKNAPQRKNKISSKEKFYRFFIYPPFCGEEKYIETKIQKKERLRLKAYYRDMFVEKVQSENYEEIYYNKDSDYYDIKTLLKMLNVSKTTLDTLTAGFETKMIGVKKYISKKDIINYINERHFISTNLDMEDMYKKIKLLQGKTLSEKERIYNENEIQKIVDSKEYKEKWKEYFKKVPEDRRVYRDKESVDYNNLKLIYEEKGKTYFDIYNPNIMISETKVQEIPKMNTINYWSAVMGVNIRTVLRYCESGFLSHYKIGGRYMISSEDFIKCKDDIQKNKSVRKNVGRKRQIVLFADDMWDSENLKNILINNKNNDYIEYTEIAKEIDKLEVQSKSIENKDSREYKSTVGAIKRLKITTRKLKRKIIDDLLKESSLDDLDEEVKEYYKTLDSLNKYKKDMLAAKKNKNDVLATQFEYIIKEFESEESRRREAIMDKMINSIVEPENN